MDNENDNSTSQRARRNHSDSFYVSAIRLKISMSVRYPKDCKFYVLTCRILERAIEAKRRILGRKSDHGRTEIEINHDVHRHLFFSSFPL